MNIWALTIVGSAVAVELAQLLNGPHPLRVVVTLWFACMCPGWVVSRFLGLRRLEQELALALGLSLALNMMLALGMVYLRLWSPSVALHVMVAACVLGVLMYLWRGPKREVPMSLETPTGEDELPAPSSKVTNPIQFLLVAFSIVGATGITSFFGFVFQLLAARLYEPNAVGLSSALMGTTLLLGQFGTLGFGTLLIGELPKRQGKGATLTLAAALISMLAGAVLGAIFVLVAPMVSPEFNSLWTTPILSLSLIAGVGLTASSIVVDDALIGMLRGDKQFWRNGIAAAMKLAVLVVFGLTMNGVTRDDATSLYAATVISLIGSFCALALSFSLYRGGWPRPDFRTLFELRHAAWQHYSITLALQGTGNLLPFVVTAMISASANAAFYVAWMFVLVGAMIPYALSTVLYATVGRHPDQFVTRLRYSLRVSGQLILVYLVLLMVGAEWILGVFGQHYQEESSILRILALGLIPGILKTHFIAVARIDRQLGRGSRFAALGSLLELILVVIGAAIGGLYGVAVGLVIALTVEGIFAWPALNAAMQRKAVTSEASSPKPQTVCAVILTYNRQDLLRQCMNAVLGQTRAPDWIVVVDNASTDGTYPMLSAEYPGIEVLRLETNLGSAGGFSEGLLRALGLECQWVWLMDDDSIPEPKALEALLQRADPDDGAPSPTLLASNVLDQDSQPHHMTQPIYGLRKPWWVPRRNATQIRAATLVSTLIRARAVQEHGLLMVDYHINCDDTEFTARLLRNGIGVFVPESLVVHLTRARPWWESDPRGRAYFGIRNEIWTVLHSSAWTPFERVCWFVLTCLQIVRYLRNHRFALTSRRIVLAALQDAFWRRPRHLPQPLRKPDPPPTGMIGRMSGSEGQPA